MHLEKVLRNMEKKLTNFVWISLPTYDKQERIEKYSNRVFPLQSHEGELRCKVLPTIVKSALILGQTNAESECSLSVNTKVVTKERVSLNEMLVFML